MMAVDFRKPPGAARNRGTMYQAPLQEIQAPPFVSVITVFYPDTNLQEIYACLCTMSIAQWEWVIVTTDKTDSAKLNGLLPHDPRVSVILKTSNATIWQQAARISRGGYVLQLGVNDWVEPIFCEEAIWFLETHPNFAFCNSQCVAFGKQEVLIKNDFENSAEFLSRNSALPTVLVRRDAYDKLPDEIILDGAENWYLWLVFAEAGLWGYTMPRPLIWHLSTDLDDVLPAATPAVTDWITKRFSTLPSHLQTPMRLDSAFVNEPYTGNYDQVPFENPLTHSSRRLLLIFPVLTNGGVERKFLQWAGWLIEQQWEISIAILQPDYFLWQEEFSELTSDIFLLPDFLNIADYGRFFRYLIKSRKVECVFLATSDQAIRYAPYLRAHCPTISLISYIAGFNTMRWHGYGLGSALSLQSTLNYLCVEESQNLIQKMLFYGASAEKLFTIPYVLNLSEWNPETFDRAAQCAKFGISSQTQVLLFVARLNPEKRPSLVVQIVKCLEKRHIDFLCVIVGEGPLQNEVEAEIEALQAMNIRLVGAQPHSQVREWMAIADCLVLPSAREGLGMVLLEAMAMRLVPVASASDGPMDVINPERGYIVPFGEAETERYADVIQTVLTNAPMRERMGHACRQFIQEKYSEESAKAKLNKMLDTAKAMPTTATLSPETASYLQLEYAEHMNYIADLEKGTTWLEGQVKNWQLLATDRQLWIDQLTDGKNWLEDQWQNWQRIAAERETEIARLRFILSQPPATDTANVNRIVYLRSRLKHRTHDIKVFFKDIISRFAR